MACMRMAAVTGGAGRGGGLSQSLAPERASPRERSLRRDCSLMYARTVQMDGGGEASRVEMGVINVPPHPHSCLSGG